MMHLTLSELTIKDDPECVYGCISCFEFQPKAQMNYFDHSYWNICELRAGYRHESWGKCTRCGMNELNDKQFYINPSTGCYYKSCRKFMQYFAKYRQHEYHDNMVVVKQKMNCSKLSIEIH